MSKSKRMPPHVQDYFDKRDGRRYLYFRKPGHKRVRLPLPIGSEEFWTAYKAALGSKIEVGAVRTVAGSISAAVVAYYASSSWNDDLSPGTRTLRKPILECFRARYGTWLLRQLTENLIQSARPAPCHGRQARRDRRQSERNCRCAGPRQRQDGAPLHPRCRPQEDGAQRHGAGDRQHKSGTFWQHRLSGGQPGPDNTWQKIRLDHIVG
jgi:hypothetical protein